MPRIEKEIMDGWEFSLNDENNDSFQAVYLPHDWAITAPFDREMDQGEAQGFRNRWGIGWYRTTYTLEQKRSGYCYYLDFGGIYENSTIWVNGIEAGGRKYGYSSFRIEITDLVREGKNQILVRADNTASPADRWYSGAGIYRTVKWIELEKKHFEEQEIVVQTTLNGTEVELTVKTGVKEIVTGVLENESDIRSCSGENGILTFQIPHAKLWSAEEPNLYKLTLYLMDGDRAADSIKMNIGLREIVMCPHKGMYVNGKKVLLKGVCLHQDVGCRGTAAKQEIWRMRLENLKEMGCNAIRAAHHIFSTEFLDLCDEMGFYVYEECFDKWKGGLYGRYFEGEWRRDVESMVKRDRNRACIFMWGVGNEVENQGLPSMLEVLRMLREHILSMDTGRPVSYAMNPHFKRESRQDVSKIQDIQKFVDEVDDREIYEMDERLEYIERIARLVDVICCNYQEQWYEEIHKRIPDKLILGTETYQYFKGHSSQMMNFTYENPQLEPFRKEYVIGSMIWAGIDYLGESMGYPSKGWSGALIRTNGERKPGYYMIQSYWQEMPMVHFFVMDYSLEDEGVKEHWDMPIYAEHWHFPQFHRTVIPYMITSNCEKVRLFLNDKEYYVKEMSEYLNRMITGFLPWQPGTVRVVGYRDNKEVCSHTVVTPQAPVKLVFDRTEFSGRAEKGYEVLLTAGAADIQGNPYFRESTMIRFQVEGPAEILAVDNGNLMGNEPYDTDRVHMYHGKASVLIRLNGEQGRIIVSAYAEGMQGGHAVIYTK